MSDTWGMPWYNHPNAPQIPSSLYLQEKGTFAGSLIGAISYGIVVALFFQCMAALLNPAIPIRRRIRWALVAHVVALFLFSTISLGIYFDRLSIEYVNNRGFHSNNEFPPGPIGYGNLLAPKATTTVLNAMFPLKQWLADGLLLHRCYIIYSMSHWVMAFPYMMYLASVALGMANIHYGSGMPGFHTVTGLNIATSYYSVCLSLDILLTLMIVIRLIVHIRDIRSATGDSERYSGLHTAAATVIMMLIESYALYAGVLLAYIIPLAVNSWVATLFSGAVGTVQVIAPYLIILRTTKQRVMTTESISGTAESIDGPLPDGDPTNATEVITEAPGEPSARNEDVIEEVPLR